MRERIERELAEGRWDVARAHAAQLWARQPTLATAGYLLRCLERVRGHVPLVPYRVALLRSFTVEPLVPLLRAGAFAGSIDLAVHVGGFGGYAQEVLDPGSELYRFRPDLAILAVQAADMPEERLPGLLSVVDAFRRHSGAALAVHDLEGRPAANAELRARAAALPAVYVVPYASLAERHGAWTDERNRAAMSMPLANEALLPLVQEWLRLVHPLSGRVAKVLVTDLDNTLWAGVLGEDGLSGIACAAAGAGAAGRAVQEALLELHARGILLALCSKNDEADALEALARHPDGLLRPAHFAARRIDWTDKPANVRALAAELNVGLDALAFLDDDVVERERMRAALPEVSVLEPRPPGRLAEAVRESPLFARLALSAEDLDRQRHYAERHAREEARRAAPSLEEFYRSLGQEVLVEKVTAATAERAAQLTQKTNQFNLTTRRYSSAEIRRLAESGEAQVFVARVKDCFGDNGLTALAIVRERPGASELDTFLLSCRVIGRGVETALLAFLCERARSAGRRTLEGRFVPTRKNAPAADFFARHGFRERPAEGEGTAWVADLVASPVACPGWIRMTVAEGALA